jgi:hypothetical protein
MLIRRRRTLEAASSQLTEQVETVAQEKTQLAETLAHQRLQYETLRAKAEGYCSQAVNRLFETASPSNSGSIYSMEPGDEEIELELLARKEALHKGETP